MVIRYCLTKKTLGYQILALILIWGLWSSPVLGMEAEEELWEAENWSDAFYKGTEFGTKQADYVPTFTESGMRKPFNAYAKALKAGEIPSEGWKIHVSANPQTAQQVAEVLPKLRQMNIHHKVVLSREKLAGMNKGDQAGKFITIYPRDIDEAKRVVKMLDKALAERGLAGPVIKGEKALGSSGLIYTRYDGFTKDTVTDPSSGEEVAGGRGHRYKPDWIEEDPWEGWEKGIPPETEPPTVKPSEPKPPDDTGPTSGQAARKHPREDLSRIKEPGQPRHRLPDYKPAPGESEAVLKLYDEIVKKKVKPVENLQGKEWLGIIDVTPDEIEKEVLKKYNYDLVVNKYPELLNVPEKRLPVLKNIVKEMIQEQVDQANRARYRMWKDLSSAYQENILKTRSFWEKHKEIKGPQSEELINQLVALDMLTQIAVTWYDEGPAVAAVHAGVNLAFYLGFKAIGSALAAYAPGSTLALGFEEFGTGVATGVASGLSYLWPVVLVNVAYNTVYLAGNWTLDVLRYDTVEKLYVNPSKYNTDLISYWTFLQTYYLTKKGLKGPANRDNLFAVFPEQNDLVTSIYAYKVWYNREAVYNQNLSMSTIYGYDAWLYMEQAALKDWEKGFNDFKERVAKELNIEVGGDRAKLAKFNAYCRALIQAGDLRDPQPRVMMINSEFSPKEPKPGDTLMIKTTYGVFGVPTLGVVSQIALQVVGTDWKSDEEKETRTVQFDENKLINVFTKETSIRIPDADKLGNTNMLYVNSKITANPGDKEDVLVASIPMETDLAVVPNLAVFDNVSEIKTVLRHAGLGTALVAAKEKPPSKEKEFKVESQSPAPDTKVKRGTTVTVAIYPKYTDGEFTMTLSRVHYEIVKVTGTGYNGLPRDASKETDGDVKSASGTLPVNYAATWETGFANLTGAINFAFPATIKFKKQDNGSFSPATGEVTVAANAKWDNNGFGFPRPTGIWIDAGGKNSAKDDKGMFDNGSQSATATVKGPIEFLMPSPSGAAPKEWSMATLSVEIHGVQNRYVTLGAFYEITNRQK